MKRILSALAALGACLFTGCYDAIFQGIRGEVPLESATVPGNINSIVRFTDNSTEYLFMQNGTIKYKKAADAVHGAWQDAPNAPPPLSYDYFSSSFKGIYFIKVAADEKNVYALGYTLKQNNESGRNVPSALKLYCCKEIGGMWTELTAINGAIAAYLSQINSSYLTDASVHLFCTNAPQPEHRKAYIRIGGGGASSAKANTAYGNTAAGNYGVIELDGTDTKAAPIVKGERGAGLNTFSAVYFAGNVRFLDYLTAVTDETAKSSTEKKDARYVYYASGTDLYSFAVADYQKDATAFDAYWKEGKPKPPALTASNMATSSAIVSLAVTGDSLLLGSNGNGIYRVTLDAHGKPAGAPSDFSTNAKEIMYSPYIIRVLFCSNPDKIETQANLYAALQFRRTAAGASANYANVGLWSYYPARGNWNRE